MRKPLTFKRLSQANSSRNRKHFKRCEKWSMDRWATAITGEIGEMCNKIKKYNMGVRVDRHGAEISYATIIEEAADAVVYIDLLSSKLKQNLAKHIRRKFNEISDRIGSRTKL